MSEVKLGNMFSVYYQKRCSNFKDIALVYRGSGPCHFKEIKNCPCEESNNKVVKPNVILQSYTFSLFDIPQLYF